MPDRELDVLVADHLLERLARPLSLEQVLFLADAEPDDPRRERGSALLLARDHLVTTDAPVDLLDLVLARAEDRRLQAGVGRSLLTLALGGIRSSWPALVSRARTSDRWATALGHAWPGPALAAELRPDLWAFVSQNARARAAGLLADGDGVPSAGGHALVVRRYLLWEHDRALDGADGKADFVVWETVAELLESSDALEIADVLVATVRDEEAFGDLGIGHVADLVRRRDDFWDALAEHVRTVPAWRRALGWCCPCCVDVERLPEDLAAAVRAGDTTCHGSGR